MKSDVPATPEIGAVSEIAAPAKKKRRRRRWILIGVLGLLAAGEVSLRILAGADSKFNIRLGAEKEWDPYRRTRWKKNYDFGEFHTNSRGFPGREFNQKKEPGSYRIICLGDSASVIPPRYSYPMALEKHLREALPGRAIDVINASCSGYDSRQARVWYEREVNDIEHDMLLIYLGWNDMGQYHPEGLAYKMAETGYLKEPSLFDKLILNVYLLRSLLVIPGYLERHQTFSTEPLTGDDLKKYSEFYPQHFEDNLKRIVSLAHANGRQVRILNYGGLVVESPTSEDQARMHFPRGMGRRLPKYLALKNAYVRALERVSADTGTPIIDCATFFSDPKNRVVFSDSAHFDERGSDMFASIVTEAIKNDIK